MYTLLPPYRFTLFLNLLLLIGLAKQGSSQTIPPHIREMSLSPNGELQVSVEGDSSNYFRLVKFDFFARGTDILDLGMITEEPRVDLKTSGVLGNSFYRVEAISLESPEDTDRDGLDDHFELENPTMFDPLDSRDGYADFDNDGVRNRYEQAFGTSIFEADIFPARIASTSPRKGEDRISASRNIILYFNKPLNLCVLDFDPFSVTISGELVAGEWKLSTTGLFVTFFPDVNLPASTEVEVLVDANVVTGESCSGFDGNGNLEVGGSSSIDFRTLPLSRLDDTHVFGYVKDSFSGFPIEGVTILVDNIPFYTETTDAEGRFDLVNMPAPEFFVHIVGETATDPPTGMTYPNIGKVFKSVPGQTTQIKMEGEPFDIFLPPLVNDDYQTLATDKTTNVVLGAGALANATDDFPDISPEEWDRFKLELPANSAVNDEGVVSTQATVILVPPDRIPEPLPSFLDGMSMVVSIQIPGATFLDTPAPITFPNTDDLAPGSKTYIWSFDHDSGAWEIIGTGTVSEDGLLVESDPGVGILAPGWHGFQPGTRPILEDGGSDEDGGSGGGGGGSKCQSEKFLQELRDSMATQLGCIAQLVPLKRAATVALNGLGTVNTISTGVDQIATNPTTETTQGLASILSGVKGSARNGIEGVKDFNPIDKWREIAECMSSTAKENLELGCILAECGPNLYPGYRTIQSNVCSHGVDILDSITGSLQTLGVLTSGELALDATCLLIDAIAGSSPDNTSDIVLPKGAIQFSTREDLPQDISDLIGPSQEELQSVQNHMEAWELIAQLSGDAIDSQIAWFEEVLSPVLILNSAYEESNFVLANDNFSLRGTSSTMGDFDLPMMTPNVPFTFQIYNPDLGLVATYEGISSESGELTIIGVPVLQIPGLTDLSGDADGDGLTADAEFILGTSDDNPDSDGDGINDGFEATERLDATGDTNYPIGTVANINFAEKVREIVIKDDIAYLLDQGDQLLVVDISTPDLPVFMSTLSIDRETQHLLIAPDQEMLIVTPDSRIGEESEAQIYFYDISDPLDPKLFRQTYFDAEEAAVAPTQGLMLAGNANNVVLMDLLSGLTLDSIDSKADLTGLAFNNTHAFIAIEQTLRIYDTSGSVFQQVGSVEVPFSPPPAFTPYPMAFDGDLLILGTFEGLVTIDISNPGNPQILGQPANTQLIPHHIKSDGAGNILMSSSNAGTISLKFTVYDLIDPTDVERFLYTIDTPGFSYNFALNNGLVYMADDTDGLTVLNYYSFGGTAAEGDFTFDLGYLDEDPGTEGIQIFTDNTSIMQVQAEHVYEVPLLRASIAVNGLEVVSTAEAPTVFTVPVPQFTNGETSQIFALSYHETRIDGSTLDSEDVLIEVIGGTAAPSIDYASPESGVVYATLPLLFRFDRFLDVNAVDLDQIEMLHLGSDRAPGGGDDTMIPFGSHIAFDDSLSLYPETSFPQGFYRLTLGSGSYTDLQGNANTEVQVFEFETFDTQPGTLIWTGGGDPNNFEDPDNWSSQTTPVEQNVYIPDTGGAFTFSADILVNNFTSQGDLSIESGAQIAVHGTFLISGNATISGEAFLSGGPPQFDGDLTMSGGTLRSYSSLTVAGDLEIGGGSTLDFRNDGTSLVVGGSITGANFDAYARDGAQLEFPHFVEYVGTGDFSSSKPSGTLFRAEDIGSSISLPNLESITGPVDRNIRGTPVVKFTAATGGLIDLPNLAANSGRMGFDLSGTNSRIDVPQLEAITGPDIDHIATIVIKGTDTTFNAPLLSHISNCNLEVRNSGPFPWDQLTSFSHGNLEVWATTPDLGNLTTFNDAGLSVRDGSLVQVGGVTTLTFSEKRTWDCRNTGSKITFPDLTSISGPAPTSGNQFLKIEAWSEGIIELPSLTTMEGGIHLSSRDTGTIIDLPVLANMSSNNSFASKIEPRGGGTIVFNNPVFTNVTVDLMSEGTLVSTTMSFDSTSLLKGEGSLTGNVDFMGKIELTNATIPITIDGSLELNASSTINPTIGIGSDKKQSGRLNVSDSLTLAGTLEVKQANAWLPEVDDEVTVLVSNTDGISGAFSTLTGLMDDSTFDLQFGQSTSAITFKVIPKP